MDLELQREVVNCFELVLDTTICQEETQEAIVSDACPDILRILDTRAQACLTGKQVRDGAVTVTGLIHARIFYLPDAGGGVRHMEMSLPFSCQAEALGLSTQGTAIAAPRLRWSEARALNPRKVLLRADLAVDVKAYQPAQLDLCCGVEGAEGQGIRQLVTDQSADLTVSVQEKPFTFSETVDFSMTGADCGDILSIQGEPYCTESKLIGSKLIFKGSVELEALVSAAGELKTVRQSLAFSQIMELAGVGENSECEIRIALADLSVDSLEAASGSGEVTVELLAQTVVRESRQVSVLCDLYSTSWQTEAKLESHLLHHTVDQGTRAVPVRELMETTTMVRTVSHCWAQLGEVRASREGDQTLLTAEVQFSALYLDDGEQLQSVHKSFSVQCRIDAAGAANTNCQCWCSAPRELFVAPAAGGLEVRFSLEFHSLVVADQQIKAVASAELGEERPKPDGTQPSMILRLAAPGERLWDIAKSYGTTAEEIIQANELEEDMVPTGRMLLIPRVR